MKPFIGLRYNANISKTMDTFNWKPINIEKTILDTAQSIKQLIDN